MRSGHRQDGRALDAWWHAGAVLTEHRAAMRALSSTPIFFDALLAPADGPTIAHAAHAFRSGRARLAPTTSAWSSPQGGIPQVHEPVLLQVLVQVEGSGQSLSEQTVALVQVM